MRPTNTTSNRWGFDAFLKYGVQLDNLIVNICRKTLATQHWDQLRHYGTYHYHLLSSQAKITILRKMDSGRYRPHLLFNFTVDICSVMSGISNPVVNLFVEPFRVHSNLGHPCPIRGHIYVKNYVQDLSDFPPIVPAGVYRLEAFVLSIYKNVEYRILDVKVHGEVLTVGIDRFWYLLFLSYVVASTPHLGVGTYCNKTFTKIR